MKKIKSKNKQLGRGIISVIQSCIVSSLVCVGVVSFSFSLFLAPDAPFGSVQQYQGIQQKISHIVPQARSSQHVFFDVPSSHPYFSAISYAQKNNIVRGFQRGTEFRPSHFLSRAELVKIIGDTLYTAEEQSQCVQRYSQIGRSFLLFPDVPARSWFAEEVCIAKDSGVIRGYPDGYFRPHQRVTFAEAASIFDRLFDLSEQEQQMPWYQKAILSLQDVNSIPMTVTRIDNPITRGEFVEILYRILENKGNSPTKRYSDLLPPLPAPCQECLVIDKINVQVPILYGAGEDSFRRQKWRSFEQEVLQALRGGVVHYPDTARPGTIGNVFLSGHSSYYRNDPGQYKEVFARLPDLQIGDEYTIYSGGRRFVYRIFEEQIISPNDFSYVNPVTDTELSTLMTCWPRYTNAQRKVFVAERVL